MHLSNVRQRLSPWIDHPLFWTVFLFGLALAARLAALVIVDPVGFGADERYYRWAAARIAEGRPHASMIFMPGWPLVLAAFAGLPERLCPILFGSITAPLLYQLGRRTLGENTGRLAGAIVALYPDHVFFSQTVYAETALETLMVALACAVFWREPWDGRFLRDAAAAAAYGAGVLFKHFAVIHFGALALSRAYETGLWRKRILLGAAFLAPLVLNGLYEKARGRDPFQVINSPMKNMGEWAPVDMQPPGFTPGHDRPDRFLSLIDERLHRPVTENVTSAVKNFCRLWTPGTYALRRSISYSAYGRRQPWFPWVHVPVYLALLVLGLFGLCFHKPSAFRRYCVALLALASAMSGFFLMFSRYRYSFMYPLILYAADVIANPGYYRLAVHRPEPGRRFAFVVSMLAVLAVMVDRLPRVTEYQ